MTNHVYVIAEAGVNHNGVLENAIRLVDAAAEAGVDAVKFQTFKADKLVSRAAPKAEYQKKTTDADESQLEMIQKLELSEDDHLILARRCQERGVQFLSTPFDLESLDFLCRKFDLPMIKLGSGEITNAPFLIAAARTGRSVVLSTGMSDLDEIHMALSALAFGYLEPEAVPCRKSFEAAYRSEVGRETLSRKVTLLHCTTEYPAPFEEVNLRAMKVMSDTFSLAVGYSDHTQGIAVPVAAAALGATVLEKHFTLNRNLPGPDHKASLEPDELGQMVAAVRQVQLALGQAIKVPSLSELKNKEIARKSLVAACDIRRGDVFTQKNITVKRPGTGISPFEYWDTLGTRSPCDYRADEVIKP